MAVTYGLPRLIQDSDVDTAMPVDCELQYIDDQPLVHPLPGESTPVALYIYYVELLKLVSEILAQLYTTSSRRGGADKIATLDRDLRVWHHGCTRACKLSLHEIGDVTKRMYNARSSPCSVSEKRMVTWLEIMVNYTMILIHRPALTFDLETQRFRDSLNCCLRCSTAILHLMDSDSIEIWDTLIAPLGPSVVFQSGLMSVLHHCYAVEARASGSIPLGEEKYSIPKALQILQRMQSQQVHGNTSSASNQLLQAPMSLLMDLNRNLTGMKDTLQDDGTLLLPSNDVFAADQLQAQTFTTEHDLWNSTPFNQFNIFDEIDWDFGTT